MSRKWRELLININLVLNKPTLHQEIWERREDDSLELVMPKIINSDIGFQLMFGMAENQICYSNKQSQNNNKYDVKIYKDIEDYKKHI